MVSRLYGGMVFYENCVWRPRPPTKIAAITKNRKFGKKSLHSLGQIGLAVSEEIIFKWFFAEFSIFSNGGYLGWRPGLSDTILKDDHLNTIPPGPNYGGMVFRWSSFRIVSDDPGRQPRWPPLLKIENSAKNHSKMISSETAGPIGPKL
jgi:hypothetical protein